MNFIPISLAYFKPVTLITLVFAFVFSCSPKTTNKQNKNNYTRNYQIISPSVDNIYSSADTIHFIVSPLIDTLSPDSIHITTAGKIIAKETSTDFKILCTLLIPKYGHQNLRLKVFYADSLSQILTSRIIVLPDESPKILNYKLLGKTPHNPESFTQGLFFFEGNLFEGTGQLGKSKLMKIDPVSGEILLERRLENDLFGEGITIHKNKIYQLTYKSMLGFIYDYKTFELIREFDLQTAEGWGLTSDGNSLIVSDGSYVLYFYDPVYFSQTNQLEVCDNKGLINNLNELEYVDGQIWANVYGEKYILQIDAKSGKVTGKLNLADIIPDGIPDNYDHVLNGIAFHSEKNSYFITGKLWPVLYEIKIIP
ncbi:MAG: glutaminyl-peptide cyclotransferase [Bacteroidales bacterium]|nr:glutaminyl-peptide cyclotransferase [Bacteroidales bacterium]